MAILCGGLGTRLGSLTANLPKALVPVLGRPFIDHHLALLAKRGLERVVLCVGHLGEMIEAHVGDGRRFGLVVTYSYDGAKQLGTAGAIRKTLVSLGDTFFTSFGDSYLDCDYRTIGAAFARTEADGLMTVFRNCGDIAPSNVRLSGDEIVAYDKTTSDPSFEYIDYGLSVYRAATFAALPADEPIDLTSVNQGLVATRSLRAYCVFHRFYEVGSMAGIIDTEAYLLRIGTAQTMQ